MVEVIPPVDAMKSNCCNAKVKVRPQLTSAKYYWCSGCKESCAAHMDDGEMEEYEFPPVRETFIGIFILSKKQQ